MADQEEAEKLRAQRDEARAELADARDETEATLDALDTARAAVAEVTQERDEARARAEKAERQAESATKAMLAATCGPVERAEWEALVTAARNRATAAESALAEARRQIDAFKAAAMLDVGTDPDGVTPAHVEREITSLRAALAEARGALRVVKAATEKHVDAATREKIAEECAALVRAGEPQSTKENEHESRDKSIRGATRGEGQPAATAEARRDAGPAALDGADGGRTRRGEGLHVQGGLYQRDDAGAGAGEDPDPRQVAVRAGEPTTDRYQEGAEAMREMAAKHVEAHIGIGWEGPQETQLAAIAKNIRDLPLPEKQLSAPAFSGQEAPEDFRSPYCAAQPAEHPAPARQAPAGTCVNFWHPGHGKEIHPRREAAGFVHDAGCLNWSPAPLPEKQSDAPAPGSRGAGGAVMAETPEEAAAKCEVCGRLKGFTKGCCTVRQRSIRERADTECYRLGYERVRDAVPGYAQLEEQLCVATARLRELGHAEVVDEDESCCDACDRAIAAEKIAHPRSPAPAQPFPEKPR